MKTAEKKAWIAERRARHHAALETLRAPGCTTPGLTLWNKLRRIEKAASDAATAQCNGKGYGSQPFRPDYLPDGSEGNEEHPTEWGVFSDGIRVKVAAVFGGTLPAGFRFNQDPRGYALKIDPDRAPVPQGMETDWGGNGLLAAVING